MNMKTLTETSTFRVLSLLLCFCFFIPAMNVSASSLQADKFKVSGIVKDATGEPVIGASVVEKGTTNGTVTDLDGNFNLSVASNSTIVISFTLNPQLHSRSATYIKRNGLLIRKITIKSSRPFQCAYHPLTP